MLQKCQWQKQNNVRNAPRNGLVPVSRQEAVGIIAARGRVQLTGLATTTSPDLHASATTIAN